MELRGRSHAGEREFATISTLNGCVELAFYFLRRRSIHGGFAHVRTEEKPENLKAFVKTNGFIPEKNNQGKVNLMKGIRWWVVMGKKGNATWN